MCDREWGRTVNRQGRVVYIDEYEWGNESGSRGWVNRMMLWGIGVTRSERRDGVGEKRGRVNTTRCKR